jgi:hypothetical protein
MQICVMDVSLIMFTQTGVPALLAATEKGCRDYMEHQKQKSLITEQPAKSKKSAGGVTGR